MIDLSGMTGVDAKAMQTHLNKSFMGNVTMRNVVNKIAQSTRINGFEHKVYPGIEGIGLAQYLPEGEPIRANSIKIREKTLTLHRVNRAQEFSDRQIRAVEPFMDTVAEVNQFMLAIWNYTIFAMLVEFLHNDPGKFGVLPKDADLTGWDGLSFYHAAHFDGKLNNTVAQTGTGPAQIAKDYWKGLTTLRKGLLPSSDIPFWEGASQENLEIVILYPTSLAEVIENVFSAEMFPAMIAGTMYNAPSDNLLAKLTRLRPFLVESAFLDKVDPNAWFAFITTKSVSPSPAAIQMIFNPKKSTNADSSEASKKGVPFEFGNIADKGIGQKGEGGQPQGSQQNMNLFLLEWLGEGSQKWIEESKAVLSTSTRLGIFGAVPYRSFKVS